VFGRRDSVGGTVVPTSHVKFYFSLFETDVN